jgi:formyltetrahydrofolate synthetase
MCKVVPGKPLEDCLRSENLPALEIGLCNLEKQIENVRLFGIPVVVAINRFDSDTLKEIALVERMARIFGADDCQVSEVWQKGSRGGILLAKSVVRLANKPKEHKYLYSLSASIKEKIRAIAVNMYGAKDVAYSPIALKKIKLFTARGWDKLPVCMAKTPLSLSHDPQLKGRPKDFILPVRDIRAFIGAGFLSPLCGSIQTMPGLPSHPRGENIDIDAKGNILGLS